MFCHVYKGTGKQEPSDCQWDIKVHYIKEQQETKSCAGVVAKLHTVLQPADLLTKSLLRKLFEAHSDFIFDKGPEVYKQAGFVPVAA
mmetsp:Transcript_36449/g.91720  ORF Transcript_36449/g.91720 Transcript_36449/m.91720 type:complete len:87 (+) Transcript_36449:44-304(+)